MKFEHQLYICFGLTVTMFAYVIISYIDIMHSIKVLEIMGLGALAVGLLSLCFFPNPIQRWIDNEKKKGSSLT